MRAAPPAAFLHVGTMKSGTSYLQGLCNANVARLAEQGVFWPIAVNCFRALGDLLGITEGRPIRVGTWPVLRAQLAEHSGPVLLSHEIVGAMGVQPRARLVEAMEPRESTVVITARDLARVVPSQWQTAVRSQGRRPWREFVEAVCADRPNPVRSKFWRRQDVAKMVHRWQKQVPLERITVVTVPPQGSDPWLLAERFGAAIHVDVSEFRQLAGSRNSRLGASSAEFLRRSNELTEDLSRTEYRLGFKEGLARLALADNAAHERAITMTPEQYQFVRRRSEQVVEELLTLGVGIVGDLADLLPPEEPPPGATAPPRDPDEGELLEAGLAVLAAAGRVLADARIEHDKLMTEAAERLLGERLDDLRPSHADIGDDAAAGFSWLALSRELRARLAGGSLQ